MLSLCQAAKKYKKSLLVWAAAAGAWKTGKAYVHTHTHAHIQLNWPKSPFGILENASELVHVPMTFIRIWRLADKPHDVLEMGMLCACACVCVCDCPVSVGSCPFESEAEMWNAI